MNRRWVILVVATLTLVGSSTVQATPGALGPVLIADLGINKAQLGLLTGAVWGGVFLTAIPAGLLIDRFGERLVLGLGVTAVGVLVVFASATSTYAVLLLLLLLAGMAAAASGPGGSRAVAVWFPARLRGLALGVRQGGSAIGGVIAAFCLPVIAVRFGLGPALVASGGVALVAGLAFLVFYSGREGRAAQPFDLSFVAGLFANRAFVLATAYGFVFSGLVGSAVSYLPVTATDRAHLGLVAAGAVLGFYQLGGFCGRILWGAVSDRLGRREPTLVAMALGAAVFCLAIGLWPPGIPGLVLGVLALLLGASGHGWSGTYLAVLTEEIGIDRAASAIGFSLAISMIGLFATPPIFGAVADRWGLPASWIGLVGLSVIGIGVALALWRVSRGDPVPVPTASEPPAVR